jgi:hypothetical protein
MISQTELSVDLWNILLQVFLAIGDTVLSPPVRSMLEIFFFLFTCIIE